MGELMRAFDWARSPLGSPETWPVSLRSVVSLLLESKFPMFLAWGPELRFLYNDAYAEMLGAKHPAALGARFEDVWAEAWPYVRRLVQAAMGRHASWREDLPLVMNRHGVDERAWLTFSYSPLEDDAGEVAGVYCAVLETTERVIEQRARALLIELDDRLRDLDDADAILLSAAETLGEHLGVDRAHWAMVQPDDDLFEIRHEWARAGVPGLVGCHRHQHGGDALKHEMRVGRVVVITDVLQDKLLRTEPIPEALSSQWRGAVFAPVVRGGVWQATLSVHTCEPHRWRYAERELVRDVAERAWTRAERARAEARVRQSEKRFRALVNATANVLFGVDARWTELRELDGDGLRTEVSKSTRSLLENNIPPEDRQKLEAAFQDAITSKGSVEMEHRVVWPDGSSGWALTRAVPVLDAHGEVEEWFGASSDVTQAHRARQALEESAERLELATEAAEVGFWDLDMTTGKLIWPPRVKRMFGISPDRSISMKDFFAGLHPEDHARVAAAFDAAIDPDRRALFETEYRTVGKEDGRLRWVAAKGRALFNQRNECTRVIGTAIDITVRKASEQHLRLMVNELNHRVKNSLATVQGIAMQTLRRGEVPEAVREALASRLIALAEAHDVLTDEKWSGAELADLAAQSAAPYVSLRGVSPIYIDGPSVFLPPRTAIAMALAFHELATNAAKYGALSTPVGKVLIAWTVAHAAGGRALRLIWRESGGPAVRPPQRTGFGTRLIQRGLASELCGAVTMDYQTCGLVCTMDALLPDEPVEGWKVDLQLS
jgi:PAS domain S-box-containing protein